MSELILSGRYKIIETLAEGGFGQTHLAEDLHLPTKPRCVVKRLKSQFSDEESFKLAHRLFEQEADVLYRLGNYPSIPNLLAHFEDNGEFVLVQEFIEGATLAQEFASGKKYTEAEAVRFLSELLETLSFVHQQNVIHRDIKPSNLIRRASDEKLFVIDFGAVKQVSVNPFNQNPTFNSTVAIGTSGYAPSEQTIGKPRYASDLYAAGLVAIQALTGLNPLQLKNSEVTGEFVWQHKAKLDSEVETFITKLTRYDFRQRYNSAKEAHLALNLIAASCGIRLKDNQTPPKLNSVPNNVPQFNKPKNNFQTPPVNNSPQFVPPTIIQPKIHSQLNVLPASRETHNFTTPKPLPPQMPPSQFKGKIAETPKVFWKSDLALVSTIVIAVLGLFFIGGYTLVKNISSSEKRLVTNNPATKNTSEMPPNEVFKQVQEMASQAAEKQKRAKNKSDWEQIAKEYRNINSLLATIEPTNPYYKIAQKSSSDYQALAENADKNAILIITPNSNVSVTKTITTTYPTPYSTPLPPFYSTPLPLKPKVATMPPPRKEKMYIAFNRSPYSTSDNVVSKVVTAVDGDFTASVGSSGAYSGSVTIRVNGGPDSCDVTFIAPRSERLQPGTYSGAQRYPFQSPTKPGLSFSGTGGCNTVAGSFTINNIIYGDDGKSILLLYATFVHRCGETAPATMGRVHYDTRY